MPVNNNPLRETVIMQNGEFFVKKTTGSKSSEQMKKGMNLPLTKDTADSKLPPPKGSWLLRLFESKLFDMSIAIAYLFNSKEPGVLAYLGNKLFVSKIRCFIGSVRNSKRMQVIK